jgi:hypothetical protein
VLLLDVVGGGRIVVDLLLFGVLPWLVLLTEYCYFVLVEW